ncbi:hypothetical protein NIB75_19750 [Bacteroides uniformis]|nr:hypothetical protein [Bacteroides uniformis]
MSRSKMPCSTASNGFNENANIPNRYKSIGHYLSGKSSTTGQCIDGLPEATGAFPLTGIPSEQVTM